MALEIERAREPFKQFLSDFERSRQQVAATFRQIADRLNPFFEELRKHGPAISRLISRHVLLETIYGLQWLPHFTTPVGQVEKLREDAEALDAAIERFYKEDWAAVSAHLRERLVTYDINEESKAVFSEAIEVHEQGHYRAVVRLLLPEVERLICIETGAPLGAPFTPQLAKFVRAADILSMRRLDRVGLEGVHLWRTLAEHLFVNVKSPAALAPFLDHGIPNRHAAIHGVIAYSTHKHSVNTILMLDYVMFMLTLAKETQAAQAA